MKRLIDWNDPEQVKEYHKKYKKQYYQKNKKKHKEYREKNKEYIRKRRKQYYQKNKKKIRIKHKEYREKNKEKIKEYAKKYRKKNKEKLKEHWKKYYLENKETISNKNKKYYQRPEVKKRHNDRGKERTKRFKKYFVEMLGNKCRGCDNDDIRCLDFHHVDPTTSKKETEWQNKIKFTKRVDEDKIMLLCVNCHRIIHYEMRIDETRFATKYDIITYLRQCKSLTLTEDMNSR